MGIELCFECLELGVARRDLGFECAAPDPELLEVGGEPGMFLLAAIVYAVTRNASRALNMLIIDYSCGVRLSTATARVPVRRVMLLSAYQSNGRR